MKSIFISILSILLLSVISQAKTVVRVPLFVFDHQELLTMVEVNQKYNSHFQTEFVLTDDPKVTSEDAMHEAYWKLSAELEKFNSKLELAWDKPGFNKKGEVKTCYNGKPSVAVDLLMILSDGLYSDQLGLWGWKYKNETHLKIETGDDKSEVADYLNSESTVWKNWKSSSKDILVLSYESDDGEDVNEGVLVKCKK